MKSKKDSQFWIYFLLCKKKIKEEVHRKKGHHHQVVDSCLGYSGHQEFSVQEPVCFGTGFAHDLIERIWQIATPTQSPLKAIDKPRLWYPQNSPNYGVDCFLKKMERLSVVIKRDVVALHRAKKNPV